MRAFSKIIKYDIIFKKDIFRDARFTGFPAFARFIFLSSCLRGYSNLFGFLKLL